ncbi:hypothetical protein Thimo_0475 [Thioflavicoccus mobilis 8321]|uniref:Uncharacterized protein n=1 Tax=Thioflavicoccus mobilis 8321 TaxID=765912 RepID=L0GRE9_9GAMM|nr:hypothetical protein [Thioflavicoccus mobilis]AGA89333.1 hypothetical protein Thimo_0475 [Thioflavicoccus mobilis 8321]
MRETLHHLRHLLLAYFRITFWTVVGTVVVTLGLYLMRLFRRETTNWDWLRATKTTLLT